MPKKGNFGQLAVMVYQPREDEKACCRIHTASLRARELKHSFGCPAISEDLFKGKNSTDIGFRDATSSATSSAIRHRGFCEARFSVTG